MQYRIDQSSLFRISATNLSKGVASNETSAQGVATKAAMYITARLAMGMFSAAVTGVQIPRINSNLQLPHGVIQPHRTSRGLAMNFRARLFRERLRNQFRDQLELWLAVTEVR